MTFPSHQQEFVALFDYQIPDISIVKNWLKLRVLEYVCEIVNEKYGHMENSETMRVCKMLFQMPCKIDKIFG